MPWAQKSLACHSHTELIWHGRQVNQGKDGRIIMSWCRKQYATTTMEYTLDYGQCAVFSKNIIGTVACTLTAVSLMGQVTFLPAVASCALISGTLALSFLKWSPTKVKALTKTRLGMPVYICLQLICIVISFSVATFTVLLFFRPTRNCCLQPEAEIIGNFWCVEVLWNCLRARNLVNSNMCTYNNNENIYTRQYLRDTFV